MSWKFNITTTPASLAIPDSAKARATERLLAANVAQMKARVDASGKPLPKGVDLKETGKLQASGQSSATGYRFNTPYAQHVDAIYHYAGVAPEPLQKTEQEISEIFESEPLEIVEG